MESSQIRQTFFDFFKDKEHDIQSSAAMVIKDDPTLMFTNAGMNQFKDIFLGHGKAKELRVANTQKCLRVSGKHNDLEEVGVDTYHHTMFEMLGNWSFGDYFKEEAIAWAWELLTEVYGIDKANLYVTVFGGDERDGLDEDAEAIEIWRKHVAEDRILKFDKKDNFWEMGDNGPCGPCSEIHVDLRTDAEKKKEPGADLVNKDHPHVVEIWNLVFMQYNRSWKNKQAMAHFQEKEAGVRKIKSEEEFKEMRPQILSLYTKLEELPARHVDTGMGFERLAMVLQEKRSNYDTDVFQPLIEKVEDISGLKYKPKARSKGQNEINVAMRVVADHVRAIAFSITDGQLPSNSGAGYVIRRILRRAVRYGYQTLNLKEPFIYRLVPVMAHQMGDYFNELKDQQELIAKVIMEEETSFFRTLDQGLKKIDEICITLNNKKAKTVKGEDVFELYDTYGFPMDLTNLIAKGYGLSLDEEGFKKALGEQRDRSRQATSVEKEDWVEVREDDVQEFIGYDQLETNLYITKYRRTVVKGEEQYQIVFNITPFYAEGGGQVGDRGYFENEDERIDIIDTKRENKQFIHIAKKLPERIKSKFKAVVNDDTRLQSNCNHSATHLLHAALRKVLGNHVEQKGSLVTPDQLRFDFSHFNKVEAEELQAIEKEVNKEIRKNHSLEEFRGIPLEEAKSMGAMALFGEKYGDLVRVIRFGESTELCGGTHVAATGDIGLFKIVGESAVAAGVRRIEAITSDKAFSHLEESVSMLERVRELLKAPTDLEKAILDLQETNKNLSKEIEKLKRKSAGSLKGELLEAIETIADVNFISAKVDLDPGSIKDLAFQLKKEVDNLFLVVGSDAGGKPTLTVMIADNLVSGKGWNASEIIRNVARHIQGGGGGQPFFATAGGKKVDGIEDALKEVKDIVAS